MNPDARILGAQREVTPQTRASWEQHDARERKRRRIRQFVFGLLAVLFVLWMKKAIG